MIADLHYKKETERLDELFKMSTKWALYSSLPLFLVICLASHEVMMVVFGSEYESGALPLVILAAGQLVNVGTGTVGFLLIMTGRQSRWLLTSGVMLLVIVALSALLVPELGLIGAALAMASSTCGLFSLGLLQVKHSLGIWPYDRRYLKGLLAAALASGASILMHLVDVGSPAISLFLTTTVSIGVFGGTLLALGLDAEDQQLIRLLRARLWGTFFQYEQ